MRRFCRPVTDYLLLMTLQLSETGTRLISRLARSLMVHASTATLATDRPETRGLIARGPHPTDRRATLISITTAGHCLTGRPTDSLRECDFRPHGRGSAGAHRGRRVAPARRRDTDDPVKNVRR